MSFRNQRPESRRVRRQNLGEQQNFNPKQLDLPGPLRVMTNPKVFVALGIIFVGALVLSLFTGMLGLNTTPNDSDSPVAQANELPDAPRDDGTTDDGTSAEPTP